MRVVLTVFLICTYLFAHSQNDTMPSDSLPYAFIPDYPEAHTAALVLARTIDGLGFRYYWATEGLREEDYSYNAGNGSRDSRDVLEHILGLSEMIRNTIENQPNIRPRPATKNSDYVRRRLTLKNLKASADYLRAHPDLDLAGRPIVFQRGENTSEVPFWHLLNGPVADALWHCGQIVSNRRASGNPLPEGVNVFMGTKN